MANPIIAKVVAALHMVVGTILWGTIMLNPIKLYEGVSDLDSTPKDSLAAMLHTSYVIAYVMIFVSSIVVCLVFSHDSPRLAMSIIAVYWLLNATCQIQYPWPTQGGVAVTIMGIPFSGAWPFIYVFVALSTVGYVTSPHDLKSKAKRG